MKNNEIKIEKYLNIKKILIKGLVNYKDCAAIFGYFSKKNNFNVTHKLKSIKTYDDLIVFVYEGKYYNIEQNFKIDYQEKSLKFLNNKTICKKINPKWIKNEVLTFPEFDEIYENIDFEELSYNNKNLRTINLENVKHIKEMFINCNNNVETVIVNNPKNQNIDYLNISNNFFNDSKSIRLLVKNQNNAYTIIDSDKNRRNAFYIFTDDNVLYFNNNKFHENESGEKKVEHIQSIDVINILNNKNYINKSIDNYFEKEIVTGLLGDKLILKLKNKKYE